MIDTDNWQDRPIYNSNGVMVYRNGEKVYKNWEEWRNIMLLDACKCLMIPCECNNKKDGP